MKKKILFTTVIILVLIVAILLFKKFSTNKEVIKILETAKVKRGDIQEIIDATAIVKTQVNAYVKVGARATGKIQKMNVDIGDYVKKGQLIAVIDQRELKKEVDRLQAELNRARANLKEIEKVYPLKIKEAEENLKKAKANYDYALWNFKREKELLKREFTTRQDYEKAEMNLKTAKADLDFAKASLNRLKEEYKVKLKEAESNYEAVKESLEKVKIKLSYTEIYSPIDGIVANITAREGETVVAGLQVANLITILNPDRLEVRIYVDETDIGKVKEKQKVIYFTDAYPNKIFEGYISKIYPEPVVKENIVYYLAIVKVKPDYAKYLRPEMTVYAKIITGVKHNVLLIPNSALKFEGGKQYVYKVMNGKPVKVFIKTGVMGEKFTEVIEGLNEGDLVATKLILPLKTKPAVH